MNLNHANPWHFILRCTQHDVIILHQFGIIYHDRWLSLLVIICVHWSLLLAQRYFYWKPNRNCVKPNDWKTSHINLFESHFGEWIALQFPVWHLPCDSFFSWNNSIECRLDTTQQLYTLITTSLFCLFTHKHHKRFVCYRNWLLLTVMWFEKEKNSLESRFTHPLK